MTSYPIQSSLSTDLSVISGVKFATEQVLMIYSPALARKVRRASFHRRRAQRVAVPITIWAVSK
jgi:hypothetical protein